MATKQQAHHIVTSNADNESESNAQSMPISTVSNTKTWYDKVSFWMITVAILLLPVFVVPYTNIGFFYAKFGLVTIAVLVSAIAFILQILNERRVERYSILLYVFLFGLPILYFISSLFRKHIGLGLMGNGSEIDTAFFFLLGSMLMYLVSRFYRSKHSIFMISLGIVSISSIVALFHVLRFVFGKTFLSLGIFSTITSNTVGSFNELGIYSGLAILISILALELTSIRKGLRILFYITIALSLTMVAVSNFSFVSSIFGLQFGITLSALIVFFSLILFIHKKVANPKEKLPVVSLTVLLVSLVLTIGISQISDVILSKIGIIQNETLDVRVSPTATYMVASKLYSSGIQSALLGVGPNSFYTAWGKYKPTDSANSVNSTAFWNVDFNMASGFIPTTFITVGILGLLAWIFFLGLIVFYIVKLLKNVAKPERDSTSVFVAWVVSVSTLYLWIVSFLYTSGPTIVFTAFICTGLLLATLVREDIIKTKTVAWDISTYWRGFSVTFGMIVLVALCMYIGYVWQQRVYASTQIREASKILQADATKITEAELLATKSINIYFNTSDLRFASDIALVRPAELISKSQGVVSPEKIDQQIVADITFAINAARRAAIDRGVSEDYRDWLQLGKAYETATFLGATSTATLAVESYAQAERLNPTNPIAPYLIGRLYAFARGFDIAEIKLKRAVELKSDYAEAVKLLESVQSVNKGGQKPTITIPEDESAKTSTTSSVTKAGSTKTGTSTKR
jgi:tetratricopeptide (TPR) repeat protein